MGLYNIVVRVIILFAVCHYVYNYFNFGSSVIPISDIEKQLEQQGGTIKHILIDESNGLAHFHLVGTEKGNTNVNKNKTVNYDYTTQISTKSDFRDEIKALTGDYYTDIII